MYMSESNIPTQNETLDSLEKTDLIQKISGEIKKRKIGNLC